MKKRVHAKVSGRVQGVFYRVSTRDEAAKLGLRGWVQNLPDGRVEFVAEGEQVDLQKLLAWARRGPSYARVDNMDIKWEDQLENLKDFRIKRSKWF